MPIPESIKAMKPKVSGTATEIKQISGHYYLYEVTSVWDAQKNRPQKKSGRSLGVIHPVEGFIPNKYYIDTYLQTSMKPHVRCYGAVEMFRQLGADICDRIRQFFPDMYRELITISLLRIVNAATGKTMKYHYEHSWLNNVYPDIGVCNSSVTGTIVKLSMREDVMERFMQSFIQEGCKLIFDGTSIFCSTHDSMATYGYNPQRSRRTQFRLIYIYDRTNRMPVFFRAVAGRIVDRKAFAQTLRSAAVTDAVIIGDKGFYSKPTVSMLMDEGLQFILPLNDNTSLIPDEFDATDGESRFDGRFTYKDRCIWYKVHPVGDMGDRVFIYQDDLRKANENALFTERQEKEWGEVLPEDSEILRNTRRGVFSFISNHPGNAKEVYLMYKERVEIEQCFDYMKHSVCRKPIKAENNAAIYAQSFINHLALLFFYKLLKAIETAGLKDRFSPEEIIDRGKNIFKIIDFMGKSQITEMTEEDAEIFKKLGVSL